MTFEGKLPVFKNRKNISKPNKKREKKKMAAPPQTTMAVDFFWLAFAVFIEIRFVPFDRELPALSNCEDDPASHHLFSIMGNVGHVVGGECMCMLL